MRLAISVWHRKSADPKRAPEFQVVQKLRPGPKRFGHQARHRAEPRNFPCGTGMTRTPPSRRQHCRQWKNEARNRNLLSGAVTCLLNRIVPKAALSSDRYRLTRRLENRLRNLLTRV